MDAGYHDCICLIGTLNASQRSQIAIYNLKRYCSDKYKAEYKTPII